MERSIDDGEIDKEGQAARSRLEDHDDSFYSDNSEESSELNPRLLNSMMEEESEDVEGISLLRQIFPDESTEELRKLFHQHTLSSPSASQQSDNNHSGSSRNRTPKSQLGWRVWRQVLRNDPKRQWTAIEPPDDFLRLPSSIAVRRYDEQAQTMRYQLVRELEHRAWRQELHYSTIDDTKYGDYRYFTVVIAPDQELGLGLTLIEEEGTIKVLGLTTTRDRTQVIGPSYEAGIKPGDILVGIEGEAFSKTLKPPLLQNAVRMIHQCQSPVVIHLISPESSKRGGTHIASNLELKRSTSLLDSTANLDSSSVFSNGSSSSVMTPKDTMHPFARVLRAKGLIQSRQDEAKITRTLAHFNERTRQWESTSSFRIDRRGRLQPHFDPKDMPPDMVVMCLPFDYPSSRSLHSYAPSTPSLSYDSHLIPQAYLDAFYGESKRRQDDNLGMTNLSQKLSSDRKKHMSTSLDQQIIYIPLMGVRKALSTRILNTFIEDTRIAYTIWVYDAETGQEWYAPIRYLSDFEDLRNATMTLSDDVATFPFPRISHGWNVFGSPKECNESVQARNTKCNLLEQFLRSLVGMIYNRKLHGNMAEISIHVQSFLGCDIERPPPTIVEQPGHDENQLRVRLLLKRSIQRYTYRLFLLGTMRAIVDHFVNTTRLNGPSRVFDVESVHAEHGKAALKARATEDLQRIQSFLDQLQKLIIEGCLEDLESISERRDFNAIRMFFHKDETYWDRLVREAVREQIEIEVYVPLRTLVSRLLVNGWRHEDLEVHFKMQELRKRPQGMFRIPSDKTSPSHWQSVATILKSGVGMSTLPCAKLRFIVDAAREISRLYEKEHPKVSQASAEEGGNQVEKTTLLGADDFLPIFIFCVVRAEMERPSALCVLLRTLCDPINRTGEIGYFLASFEAAIAHIQDIDLTEDSANNLSFLSVPLTEISLNE